MKKIAFIFSHSPHATSHGREGLDAVLATSAYSENLALYFVGKGVSQLLKNQHPQSILSRDYISAFGLLELYDVEEVFVCATSLYELGFTEQDLILEATVLEHADIAQNIASCDVVLRF
ncbi:tRNA 2-thiouridine(34) synthase TusC [Vibrio sp. UCD-FRSSP16_10]|uniref:sulfurtransferase complex subunit TusC n=1 Tax=unclassified Vibrio TaxID=2614977 RepID=UPI0007FBA2F6|nr:MULTISPECIES: sulfurtransferase complex subunit TusC [unclassified Vibrio]OBT10045.1 tRNA 2-thiouridine(34) synthase TusC [Vibrio sp. UCD-FRSSP16_30]OBT18835.1 tRNA 2-thiouridine(34) synthase TusC [Vibrio sp. UCD-FRSSP16_10]